MHDEHHDHVEHVTEHGHAGGPYNYRGFGYGLGTVLLVILLVVLIVILL
jgi:hypothetical protein